MFDLFLTPFNTSSHVTRSYCRRLGPDEVVKEMALYRKKQADGVKE